MIIRNRAIIRKGVQDGTLLGDFFFFNPEMYSGSLTALKSKNIKHEGSMSGAMENSSVGFLLLVLERV